MVDDSPDVDVIFTTAVELSSPVERAEYVRQACGEDEQLRSRVEQLIDAHLRVGDFLEQPAATIQWSREQAPQEGPGTRIGRYKLLEEIGEGGFGVVFMAEQEEPVRRRVALKIIKAGMDTRQVVARFEAERQALAMMDHANIAKVLDAGATDSGRPYFVMELIKGVPITKYCDAQKLSIRKRLKLFVQVCQAVQHAHQKGIIHRDLKPSNVLVTLHDDTPVPKIIDFGVAKAIEGKLTDRTLFTGFHQLMGTPAYMSPEQAQLSGLDVDTRSDIYSLGVLLYELLTGSTPFDSKQLLAAPLGEMQRIVREVEPPSPSTRVSTLAADARATLADERQVDPQRLAHSLRGDLDWIVMRCLEKDRTRRYATANSLALDAERYLADEPVEARPPTAAYRLRKFVRRNKLGVLAGSAVILALVAGLALAAVGLVQARQQAAIARTEATRSEQVVQFLRDMLAGVGPGAARGQDTTLLRGILDQTAERLGADLADQPELEAELRETLGFVYRDLGELESALAMFERGLALRREIQGDHLAVVRALRELGIVLMRLGRDQEAEVTDREALTLCRKLVGPDHPELAHCLGALGGLLRRDAARRDESEMLLREAVAIQRKASGDDHLDVAAHLTQLGLLLRDVLGQQAEAESCFREILDIRSKQLGHDHHMSAGTMYQLGSLLVSANMSSSQQAEGVALLREALAIQGKVLGENHRDTTMSRDRLDSVLSQQGRANEAWELKASKSGASLTQLIEALNSSFELLVAANSSDATQREQVRLSFREVTQEYNVATMKAASLGAPEMRSCIGVYVTLASRLASTPNRRQALGELSQSFLSLMQSLLCENSLSAGHRWHVGHALREWAFALPRSGEEAPHIEAALQEAVDVFGELAADDPHNGRNWHFLADTHRCLGIIFAQSDRHNDAENSFRKALEIVEENEPLLSQRAINEFERAAIYFDLAHFVHPRLRDEAERLWSKGCQVLEASAIHDSGGVDTYYQLALAQAAQGDLDAYRRTCRAMIERFPVPAADAECDRLAWTCCLAPEALDDLSIPIQHAADEIANNPHTPYYLVAWGALQFRAGRYEEAAAQLEKAIDAFADDNTEMNGLKIVIHPQLFMVMTQWRRGRHDDARRLLADMQPAIDNALKAATSWNRRATIELLHREAAEMVGEPSVVPQP